MNLTNLLTHSTALTTVAALGALALTACGGKSPATYPSDSGYRGEIAADASEAPASYPQPGYSPSAGFDGAGAPEPPPAPMSADDDGAFESEQRASKTSQHRPGLATSWGEQRFSRVTSAPFVRAEREHPFAVGKLFYNDPSGLDAQINHDFAARTSTFPVAGGHLEVGLRDSGGHFLTGFVADGDNFVSGIAGERYTIVIENHSPGRVEAVVSVDGLDVIDGKHASFSKRGYLIDPFGELEIEGFRTSTSEVAAFRFGSVGRSYAAEKHGDTRNVGVIGLALFHERGDSPSLWGSPRHRHDRDMRNSANPFPQQFASPPR